MLEDNFKTNVRCTEKKQFKSRNEITAKRKKQQNHFLVISYHDKKGDFIK